MKSIHQTTQRNYPLSVAIITKNRPHDVHSCLESLRRQTVPPDEFIVVDSSTKKETKDSIETFASTVRYPVIYIHEPRLGFPVARNHVLRKAKNRWVAFTDDDCVIDPNWVKQIKNTIKEHPRLAAIAGESQPYFVHNMISQVTNFNEQHWKKRVIRHKDILDLETLDNKNVAYNLNFFRLHHIRYDEGRTQFFGASDDCDLGMQIQQSGGQAICNPDMIVYHKDLVDLCSYTKRIITRAQAHATYERKWKLYRKTMHFESFKQIRFLKFYATYIDEHGLNLFESFILFSLLIYSSLLNKCVKFYTKRTILHG
jgi:glycosyltransferase involved in cell wall biosynthesis